MVPALGVSTNKGEEMTEVAVRLEIRAGDFFRITRKIRTIEEAEIAFTDAESRAAKLERPGNITAWVNGVQGAKSSYIPPVTSLGWWRERILPYVSELL